ncbi:MAG TPA: 30S ribosomal protein S20 [Bacilli bacterium]|nr:30S ribosomal protein S20 [Bacilli bacterium]
MPNIKSAKKRVKTDKIKNVTNNTLISSMRSANKRVRKDIKESNKDAALNDIKLANKKIDKAAKKGLIHKNKAARIKSKLQKAINNNK